MSCDSRMRETCKVSEVLAGACLAGRLASALGALFGLNTHLSGPSRSVIVASPSPLVRRELSNTRMILKGGSVPQQGPAGQWRRHLPATGHLPAGENGHHGHPRIARRRGLQCGWQAGSGGGRRRVEIFENWTSQGLPWGFGDGAALKTTNTSTAWTGSNGRPSTIEAPFVRGQTKGGTGALARVAPPVRQPSQGLGAGQGRVRRPAPHLVVTKTVTVFFSIRMLLALVVGRGIMPSARIGQCQLVFP